MPRRKGFSSGAEGALQAVWYPLSDRPGLSFGTGGFVLGVSGELLMFRHTFNVNLREAATWALMIITGLVGLGIAGRRRGRAS